MRILVINKRAPFEGRGAEQVIWKIALRLAQEGHEVLFFTGSPTESSTVPDVDGIQFEFVDTGANPTRGMIEFFIKGPLAYRRVYRRFDPDLVYDNPSPFPFHLAHLYGDAPIVSKVHAIYRRLAFSCKNHPLVKLGTIAGEETYRTARGEYFITNSESTAERLSELVNTDVNQVAPNPIGIDASEFDYHVPEESKHVLTVSKLSPRKRINDLLRAWMSVENQHPDASLSIAGSGPLADDLHSLRDELGLNSVAFLGYVSEERKHELLHDAAIFASPTLFEGFGLSNLEAMASGCAIVSTDTWGVKDYVEDGVNGKAVPPKSPTEFGDAITNLLDQPAYRGSLAERAKTTAESYSITESLDRELANIESIRERGKLESSG